MYHEGSRQLQDQFDTRRLADTLAARAEERSREITAEDRAFIQARDMFFLATADAEGRPNCSYKGGEPGFVRVVDGQTIAFPNYDGNGMYLSMGKRRGQSARRPAVHRFRGPAPAAVEWDGQRRSEGSAARRLPGGAVCRAGAGAGSLRQLPAVHS